jgi:hypothetical protein
MDSLPEEGSAMPNDQERSSGLAERINQLTSKGQMTLFEALSLWELAEDDEMSVRCLVADLESSGKRLSYVYGPTQEIHPAVTQPGDNWTDDQESESPPAMGANPSEEEDAGTGFTKERDRMYPKLKKNQPLTDPGEAGPGHSEIQDRYTQAPRDGA